jgi:protein-tyrosine phosphatase
VSIQILLVCTANICRSPMAERLLRRAAASRGAEATVESAGLLTSGRPASPGAVSALTARGLDLTDHRSRLLDADMVRTADLVVAMEVAHVRDAASLAPERFGATFTLRELVDRVAEIEPRRDRPIHEWLEELGTGRRAADLLRATGLDVADPYGGPLEGYLDTAAELDRLTEALAEALWGER